MQITRPGPLQAARTTRGRSTCVRPLSVAVTGRAQTTDLTSNVLGTAISLALKSRLKAYSNIQVDVTSTAWDLAGGRFGGMKVTGAHWRTPLMLTAQQIQLEVGELVVDYPALVFQGRVALKNIPTGNCRINLTATDLGNLMVHPLMRPAASKAVQGKPFVFDKGSVRMALDAQGAAYVSFEGVAAADGNRYKVVMTPIAGGRLRVASRQVIVDSSMSEDDDAPSYHAQPNPGFGAGSNLIRISDQDAAQGAGAVAAGLTKFFTELVINLQGVELTKPALSMIVPQQLGAVNPAPGRTSPQLLLSIAMTVRLLNLPPMDMQF